MKRFLALLLALSASALEAVAAGPPVRVTEVDGSPSVIVGPLIFPNGSLTPSGGGVAVSFGTVTATNAIAHTDGFGTNTTLHLPTLTDGAGLIFDVQTTSGVGTYFQISTNVTGGEVPAFRGLHLTTGGTIPIALRLTDVDSSSLQLVMQGDYDFGASFPGQDNGGHAGFFHFPVFTNTTFRSGWHMSPLTYLSNYGFRFVYGTNMVTAGKSIALDENDVLAGKDNTSMVTLNTTGGFTGAGNEFRIDALDYSAAAGNQFIRQSMNSWTWSLSGRTNNGSSDKQRWIDVVGNSAGVSNAFQVIIDSQRTDIMGGPLYVQNDLSVSGGDIVTQSGDLNIQPAGGDTTVTGTLTVTSTINGDGSALTALSGAQVDTSVVPSLNYALGKPSAYNHGTVAGGGTVTLRSTNSVQTVTFSGATATIALPTVGSGTYSHLVVLTNTYTSGDQVVTISGASIPRLEFDSETAQTTFTNSQPSVSRLVQVKFDVINGAYKSWSAVGDAFNPAGTGSGGTPDDDSVTAAKLADGDFGDWSVASNVASLDAGVVDADELAVDAVNDTKVDWGTGANQVSAADVPLEDSGGNFTTDDVESALAQLADDFASAGLWSALKFDTTDDTLTTLYTNGVTAGTTRYVEYTVLTGGSTNSATYKVAGTARNDAGTLTLISTNTVLVHTNTGSIPVRAYVKSAGTNLILEIAAVDAENMHHELVAHTSYAITNQTQASSFVFEESFDPAGSGVNTTDGYDNTPTIVAGTNSNGDYTAIAAHDGAQSFRQGGLTQTVRFDIPDSTQYSARFWLYWDAGVAASHNIFKLMASDGTTELCSVRVTASETLAVYTNGGASTATVNAMSEDTWYSVRIIYTESGTSSVEFSTDGTFTGSGNGYTSRTSGAGTAALLDLNHDSSGGSGIVHLIDTIQMMNGGNIVGNF